MRSLALVMLVTTSCNLDRGDCDRALEKVCACPSMDCDAAVVPPIVEMLRRCDKAEILDAPGYHLPVCIQGADDYCAILTGVTSRGQELCDVECTQASACDQQQACHEFQYASCDVPGGA